MLANISKDRTVHYRIATSEDEKPFEPSFKERLMHTRACLLKETESGEMDWNDTIKHIDELLNELGV
jgi:hypothetical protein